MKKYTKFLWGCLLLSACAGNPKPELTMEVSSTIPVESTDTEAMIIEKAAHVVPKPEQLEALKDEFIAFIHLGPNTFTRKEWGNGMEDPRIFDLKTLDTDQWCEAMKEAGMTKVILTAKHHDGFVLWQSRYTQHGIMSCGFQDGKGDIMKDLSASCQKYGLKLGVYLSPADLYQIEHPDGLYGNLSKYTKRTIPREVPGRPFANKTTFEFELDDYNEYFMNQLFELLTEYGPVHEVWFDGAHPKRKGGQTYNYLAWKELIRTLAPDAVIFGKEDLRWCGNEGGHTRNTEYNVIPYAFNPDTANYFPDLTDIDLGSREQLVKGKYLHYQQAETNTSIREGWFYRDDERQRVRSVDDVFDIYERSVGTNSTFLLNIPPNREGRFSEQDVNVLTEVGKRIRQTYTTDLLADAKGAKELLDTDDATFIGVPAGSEGLVIKTKAPVTLNRFMIQEAIATHGERVEKHALDAWVDGAWKEITTATNIGYKRILRFPDVTSDKWRVRILESRLTPAISKVAAFYYEARPPRLSAHRNADGLVVIEGMKQDFRWNAGQQDIARNLSAGYKIYYTTDGSEPTEQSAEYKAPFAYKHGEVKAIAVLNGQVGEVSQSLISYEKKNWQVKASGNSVTIQLEDASDLAGMSYMPPRRNTQSILKGTIQISNDGKTWNAKESFEFGNLTNDPTRRYHHFKQPANARFVRINANLPIDEKVREFDLF